MRYVYMYSGMQEWYPAEVYMVTVPAVPARDVPTDLQEGYKIDSHRSSLEVGHPNKILILMSLTVPLYTSYKSK